MRLTRRGTRTVRRLREQVALQQAERFVRLLQAEPLPPAEPVSVVALLLAMADDDDR